MDGKKNLESPSQGEKDAWLKLNKWFSAEVCVYFPYYGIISLWKMALQLSSQESLAQVSEKGTKITLLYKTLYPMQPGAKLHKSWLTQLFHRSKHCKWDYGFCNDRTFIVWRKDRLNVDLSFLLQTCMKFIIKSHTWALKKKMNPWINKPWSHGMMNFKH